MALLALDLGTRCGFAYRGMGVLVSGTQDFSPKRHEGGGMRYLRFSRWLNELHETDAIVHIGYEEVQRHAGTAAAHTYGGFMSHLLSWAEERKVPVEAFAVGAIKKAWTGKGNANKDAMIDEAKRRGFDPIDDNEADALAILALMEGSA